MSTWPKAPGCSPTQEFSFAPHLLVQVMQLVHYFILLYLTISSNHAVHTRISQLSLPSLLVWHLPESPWASAQKDSLHFGLSTGRKLFSINALWGWSTKNHFHIIKSEISCGFYWCGFPFFPELRILFMATSISLWVCPALAGELQSIPALPRTMMDTFVPYYCFNHPQIHILYFILSRGNTSKSFETSLKNYQLVKCPVRN